MTATASALHRDTAGRFAKQPPATCTGCGWTLAESLAGFEFCPNLGCDDYRLPVDLVPGVRLGVLTAADVKSDECKQREAADELVRLAEDDGLYAEEADR